MPVPKNGWRPGEPIGKWLVRSRPEWHIIGRERREILPQYVRRIKGELFQVRIYIANYGPASLNFGLFHSVGAAERASIKVQKLLARGKTPWEALRLLQQSSDLPGHILPTYVYARPDGRYGARVGKRGPNGRRVVLECPGPFAVAEEAYEAMVAEIRRWERANPGRPVKRAA